MDRRFASLEGPPQSHETPLLQLPRRCLMRPSSLQYMLGSRQYPTGPTWLPAGLATLLPFSTTRLSTILPSCLL